MTEPEQLARLTIACEALGFSMSCDPLTGALLRTLAASKPAGRILELGTGAGMSAAWIIAGMSADAALVSVENSEELVDTARSVLGDDPRVTFLHLDAATYLAEPDGSLFDLVFADTWAGKFDQLPEALALLAEGGVFVVDDLNPQLNWPDGHAPKVVDFKRSMHGNPGLFVTELDWSTGIMIATRAD
jgi:predicted O-methyltransferase YrrM